MRKLLCWMLAALLAVLPCCGMAESADALFESLNLNEVEKINSEVLNIIEKINDVEIISMHHAATYIDLIVYSIRCESLHELFSIFVTYRGEEGKQGINVIEFDFDVNEDLRQVDEYWEIIDEIIVLCIRHLNSVSNNTEAGQDYKKMSTLIDGYRGGENIYASYYRQFDVARYMKLEYFQSSHMKGSEDGSILIEICVN